MSWNFSKWFRDTFTSHASTSPHVPPTAPVTQGDVIVRVYEGDVAKDEKIVGATVTLVSQSTGTTITGTTDGAGNVTLPKVPFATYQLTVTSNGFVSDTSTITTNRDNAHEWPVSLTRASRQGIVHIVNGTQIADDTGIFSPVGATLMWALHGWKFERDRVKQNIQWLAAAGVDYVRILGEVGWAGNDISPDLWPDYDQLLAELIDWCYGTCGVRVQITIIGGGTSTNYENLVERVITIVSARKPAIFLIEVANEAWQNFTDEGRLKKLGRRLLQALAPMLIALSSPDEADEANAKSREWVQSGYANIGVKHFARSHDEDNWKPVRKPWEGKDAFGALNEPQGPRSSGAEYTEAVHIVMERAVGILCHYVAFVIHNGAGVAGQVDPAHNRPANLWEVPGIDEIMKATRGLDAILPSWAGTGSLTRKGLGNHPFEADAIWTDGADHGVTRDYACLNGGAFWQTLIGIKKSVTMTSHGNYHIRVYNPVTAALVNEQDVSIGQTVRFDAAQGAQSSTGTSALLVVGTPR